MDTAQDRVDRAMALVDIETAEKLRRDAEQKVQKAQAWADECEARVKAAKAHARKIGALR